MFGLEARAGAGESFREAHELLAMRPTNAGPMSDSSPAAATYVFHLISRTLKLC